MKLETVFSTLVLGLAMGFSVPTLAGELDGEELPADMTQRIMIRKNPKNADDLVAYKIPNNISVAKDELEGLTEEQKATRVEEIVKSIEKPENLIKNPKSVLKELSAKNLAAMESRGELDAELSTPACGWRSWRRAAFWGASYFAPVCRWATYYYPVAWVAPCFNYAWGFYGNGWW